MFQCAKKKIEELTVLMNWFTKNVEHILVHKMESEDSSKTTFKVFSPTSENQNFVIVYENNNVMIENINEVEVGSRYSSDELHHPLLRLYKMVENRYDHLMDVNSEIEKAIDAFRED